MDEQKIQSNLKKLIVVFLAICLLIGGIAQYLLSSVSRSVYRVRTGTAGRTSPSIQKFLFI